MPDRVLPGLVVRAPHDAQMLVALRAPTESSPERALFPLLGPSTQLESIAAHSRKAAVQGADPVYHDVYVPVVRVAVDDHDRLPVIETQFQQRLLDCLTHLFLGHPLFARPAQDEVVDRFFASPATWRNTGQLLESVGVAGRGRHDAERVPRVPHHR